VTDGVDRARDLLARARRVVVLTGAGVSAESGVPTFRGSQGLWRSHRPEDLATPEAFARDPLLVWEWYAWRRSFIARCEPNPAHTALARYLADHPTATLVTQNVDGLHQRAARAVRGADTGDADRVLEVHGAIHRDRCSSCGLRAVGAEAIDTSTPQTLPRCASCGGALRPDVVWFGEALDEAVIGAAFRAAREAEVCLVVGTSGVVYPAASVPEITRASGGSVVEVNPEETPLTRYAAVSLRGPAGSLVPHLLHG